ncbi:ribosome small subunit-dependent GTPase A [Pengzhenrongella sicca]|uniref:Small ribosomal subunit biogenesis GTPase RsgA n=1 Tax=Pengzhenrongella sicca TaxID=2819238 RepID=A0A8A4ZGQ2_9MICO|nr:ribosome small subunit-dependent GTPase A [Pengzhenrongella sicca]QTE29667.1 ribosome small subunit-dependent GTPase A [Pengzhenrongella sicca]
MDSLTVGSQVRVVRVDRGAVLVVPADAASARGLPVRVELDRDGLVPGPQGLRWAPTVGDVAVSRPRADGVPHLAELLPRRTELVRDSAGSTSRTQALAANVDVVLVAEHLDPEPDLGRIERLLTLAWRCGARPVVVLTKADLVPRASIVAAEVTAAAPGADVHVVSATADTGLEPLRALLRPGVTLVVVGPSGAGKSTLVNALAGAEVMSVGDRRADGRGRHTTTHRELIALDCGAFLIDTPGLRAVGVVADAAAVEATFPDVAELALACRFADCAHESEPGCAVRAALESGELPERRFDSWRRLAREAAWQARRSDARLAALEKARWKQKTAEYRREVRGR